MEGQLGNSVNDVLTLVGRSSIEEMNQLRGRGSLENLDCGFRVPVLADQPDDSQIITVQIMENGLEDFGSKDWPGRVVYDN